MARSSPTKNAVQYMAGFGALYIAYELALQGKLGTDLRLSAEWLREQIRRGAGGGAGPGQPPGAPPAAGSGSAPTPGPASASARLRTMLAANPNLYRQMLDWQAARVANGEDPYNWWAFRQHLRGLGAPDPGDYPPDEFSPR